MSFDPQGRKTSGRCACISAILALILLPLIVAHPILGFIILVFLLSGKD